MKRGRPKKSETDAKRNPFKLRMTDEEIDILNKLSIETGKTKSEIVIEALKIYNNVAEYID